MIELRLRFLNISIEQMSEASGVDRQEEEARIVYTNKISLTTT